MSGELIIALDGMGGDRAPRIVVEGAHRARQNYPQARFIIFGDEKKIRRLVNKHKGLSDCVEIRHTPDKISSGEKPSVALRTGRNSSMRLAIDAVANGEAHCCVSAGNTGALMAMAKFSLHVIPGIRRPAIASIMPCKVPGREYVMLDLGANIQCGAKALLEFGVLGGVFSREILKRETPKIALLNIGSEAMKGHEDVKEAAALFEKAEHLPGEYVGFIEGDTMFYGEADVVVADGFTGNVALKTMEGTARLVLRIVKRKFQRSLLMKLGALLCLPGLLVAMPALWALKKQLDPRYYNGASLLGLKGLCIKSHGGTDGLGFANAIGVAADMVLSGFNQKVVTELETLWADVS